MRSWWTPVFLGLIAACSSDRNSPAIPPDVPANLTSTTLDRAVALSWSDNAYTADPANFESYGVYSTTYDFDNDLCGGSWALEGTTVAPEFVVGALTNGVSRCFSVTARSVEGAESARSQVRADTPRPDSRNVALNVLPSQDAGSGFRFWDDLNNDQEVQDNELGLVRPGSAAGIDFVVERDLEGSVFLAPVRPGTGVEFYSEVPVGDLTSVNFAPCIPDSSPDACAPYATSSIEASPGFGYVFETDGGDGFVRYGAVRVTHVGPTLVILDWAFQTDRGNPELLVGKNTPTP
ncbi:MAG: hypothetical protein H0T58_05165 [Gemmatimonadales bacterium]|nr:hypothetical protein [Gemmatimonadales bacterium]